MKSEISEFVDSDYRLDLEAESAFDSAMLVRMGLNSIKKPPAIFVRVGKDGMVRATIYIRGTRMQTGTIVNQFK